MRYQLLPLRCNEKRAVRTLFVILICYFFCSVFFLYHLNADALPTPPPQSINAETDVGTSQSISRGNSTNTAAAIHSSTPRTKIWLAGMILDFDKMQPRVKQTLLSLNCNHNVGIHILLPDEAAVSQARYDYQQMKQAHRQFKESSENAQCAPIIIQHQNQQNFDPDLSANLSNVQNRIDRISRLRDLQRLMLETTAYKSNRDHDDSIVIIADLDLYKLPDVEAIMKQISQVQDSSYPHDAICAAGITIHGGGNTHTKKMEGPELWYYDTFATVFLPDTFSHPLKRRLIPRYYPREDPRFVRSNDQFGNFTQGDIYRYFRENGGGAGDPTRVKSCFGGMAIYRAHAYFERTCRYRLVADEDRIQRFHEEPIQWDRDHAGVMIEDPLPDPDSDLYIMRYANNKEGRPCEHVVFHDCLRDVSVGVFDIAVNPMLRSLWARDF
jgi:hypothetical protein